MGVTSEDLFDGARDEARGGRIANYSLALIAALIFAALWWLPTAKTTVDGWVRLLNIVGELFGGAWLLTAPVGWWSVGLAVAVGLTYSRIETVGMPKQRGGIAWLGWAFIAASDAVTTGMGVLLPPPDAWPIHQQLAHMPYIAIPLVVLSTFCPDWIIFTVIKRLFGKR